MEIKQFLIVKGFVRLSKVHQFAACHIGYIVSTIMVFYIVNPCYESNRLYYYNDAPISQKRQRLIYIKSMTKKLMNKYSSLTSYFNMESFLNICNQRYSHNRFEMRQYLIYSGYLRINKPTNLPWVIEQIICAFFVIYYEYTTMWYPCGASIRTLRKRSWSLQKLIHGYITLQIAHCTSTSYLTNRNSGFDFDVNPYNNHEPPCNPFADQMNYITNKLINNERIHSMYNNIHFMSDLNHIFQQYKWNNPITTPIFYTQTSDEEASFEDNDFYICEDDDYESLNDDEDESLNDDEDESLNDDEYIQMILIHGFYRQFYQTIISPIAWLIYIYYSQKITYDDNKSIDDKKDLVEMKDIIIEWSQSTSEVELFLEVNKNITSKDLEVIIQPNHIFISDNNDKKIILNDNLKYRIDIEDSSWFLNEYKENKKLWMILQKEKSIWWNDIFSKEQKNRHWLTSEIIIEQDLIDFDIEWSFFWCV